MKNKIKLVIIIIILLFCIGFIGYGVYYIINNQIDKDAFKTELEYVSPSDQYIDKYEQNTTAKKVTSDTLPSTDGTLTTLNYKEFTKLFSTSKKSILILEKTDCSYCQAFEPLFIEALEDLDINAYKIDVSTFSDKEYAKLYDYLYYEGTPTVFIIENGLVKHTYSGYTTKEVIEAFLDIYYVRNDSEQS